MALYPQRSRLLLSQLIHTGYIRRPAPPPRLVATRSRLVKSPRVAAALREVDRGLYVNPAFATLTDAYAVSSSDRVFTHAQHKHTARPCIWGGRVCAFASTHTLARLQHAHGGCQRKRTCCTVRSLIPAQHTFSGRLLQACMCVYQAAFSLACSPTHACMHTHAPPPFLPLSCHQDHPLAIGEGQTISAPHMHAICLELLEPHLTPGARVLDVGAGQGVGAGGGGGGGGGEGEDTCGRRTHRV